MRQYGQWLLKSHCGKIGKLTKGVKMYLVIEETTYQYVPNHYVVECQDESFSKAQEKKKALELLNEKSNVKFYVASLPVKLQKTG
jgi:hypothetical protein